MFPPNTWRLEEREIIICKDRTAPCLRVPANVIHVAHHASQQEYVHEQGRPVHSIRPGLLAKRFPAIQIMSNFSFGAAAVFQR